MDLRQVQTTLRQPDDSLLTANIYLIASPVRRRISGYH
jgi:hypothetical protein